MLPGPATSRRAGRAVLRGSAGGGGGGGRSVPMWVVCALVVFALVPFALVAWLAPPWDPHEAEPVFEPGDLHGRALHALRTLRREHRRRMSDAELADPGAVAVYVAGLPRLPRVIARDLLAAALIRDDADDLRRAVIFCAAHQGRAPDALTGEEPGKVFHEHPAVHPRGTLSTAFNSLDATPLFVIAAFRYALLSGDARVLGRLDAALRAAVRYIRAHVDADDLFFDAPGLSGAREYAVKVTYWKDAMLHGRPDGTPQYPVVYSLAHAQALCALRLAAVLLRDDELDAQATRMVAAMRRHLWDDKAGVFRVGRDAAGPLPGLSSDTLHLLWYLHADDIDASQAARIAKAARGLETVVGFAATRVEADVKHGLTVWPYEQAFIHAAALHHGGPLRWAASVARRADGALSQAPSLCERLRVDADGAKIEAAGATTMLWTAAAALYLHAERATVPAPPTAGWAGVVVHAAPGAWPRQLRLGPAAGEVRGVAPGEQTRYQPTAEGEFACLRSSQRVPYAALNDDYCDCDDETDEPGTSACPSSRFFCEGAYIPSGRVGDGVRDCVLTGADEG